MCSLITIMQWMDTSGFMSFTPETIAPTNSIEMCVGLSQVIQAAGHFFRTAFYRCQTSSLHSKKVKVQNPCTLTIT
jgi:hypothetical protein